MQTSLRSNYQQQYYDYGTLDCATSHIDQQTNHQHHSHQLLEDTVSSIQQSNHHVQPSPTVADHNHQLHHHQLSQAVPQGFALDQQPAEGVVTRLAPDEQLTNVYNQSHNHHYQLLASSTDQLNLSSETDIGAGNLDATEGLENQYHLQQHAHHHQQQHVQPAAYQTIYYEPINFTDNCAPLEPGQPEGGDPQEQQAFTSHLIHPTQFTDHHQQQQSELQQQPPGPAEGNYFQYLHLPTEELVSNHQNHSESPLPQAIDHHQQQPPSSYLESQHQTVDVNAHNQQIYQTLDVASHQYEQQLDHATQERDQFCSHAGQPDIDVQQSSESQFNQCKQDSYHQASNDDHEQLHYINNFYLDSGSTGVSISHSQESRSSAASTSSSEESLASSLTRDEKRAREANIPMSYYEIVNLSIEQFNEQLSKHSLSESQLTLIKDIRRRGKNKVAAQSCRKRKMEQIYELQHEVNQLASKRKSLSFECSQLIKEHGNLVQEYDKIYAIIQERMHYEPSMK